uniref:ORF 115 protein n=1 Tax=Saccharomyces cerevisiae TaxID=4932 RepID=A2NY33_YEASX|nr:ORF 115 [Saccharomyces cerevisiae]
MFVFNVFFFFNLWLLFVFFPLAFLFNVYIISFDFMLCLSKAFCIYSCSLRFARFCFHNFDRFVILNRLYICTTTIFALYGFCVEGRRLFSCHFLLRGRHVFLLLQGCVRLRFLLL